MPAQSASEPRATHSRHTLEHLACLREASRRLGITQPQTRQLEERALERLAGLREVEALREAA